MVVKGMDIKKYYYYDYRRARTLGRLRRFMGTRCGNRSGGVAIKAEKYGDNRTACLLEREGGWRIFLVWVGVSVV